MMHARWTSTAFSLGPKVSTITLFDLPCTTSWNTASGRNGSPASLLRKSQVDGWFPVLIPAEWGYVLTTAGQTVAGALALAMMVAIHIVPEPSYAAAPFSCLTGTDPEVAGDFTQINTVRSTIDQFCPCSSFDGSRGKTRADYARCARGEVNAAVEAGTLRKQCRGLLSREVKASTCGAAVDRDVAPCIRKEASGVTCAITSPARCGGVSCPGHTSCVDAADSNENGFLDEGDAGTCTSLPRVRVSPLTLRPAFSAAIHDYTVSCSAGLNELVIDMGALPGGLVSLSAPISTEPAQSASVAVSVQEDQAVVVQLQNPGESSQEYWIRCLPHDFPPVSATPHPEVGTPSPGWYLFSNFARLANSGTGGFAMIVDANGTPIWYRRLNASIVEPLPDSTLGIISVLSFFESSGAFHDLDAGTTTSFGPVGVPLDMHELLLLPNGNYMMLSYPTRAGVDLTDLAPYSCGANCTVYDCAVQEVDPAGNLVWDWRTSDHTDPLLESLTPVVAVGILGDGTDESPADVYHCNSIDADADGNVLVSYRHMNAVLMISKATGRVVWKLGGTAYNKDGAQILTIVNDPATSISGQHDARFRPNGNISLFDNQSFAAGPARALEYQLDLDAGTAELVWQYQGTARSVATGSFRRYADGSNVIGWGWRLGSPNQIFSEVNDAGENLLDMVFEGNGNWTYRVLKVPVGTYDIGVLRETAGLP